MLRQPATRRPTIKGLGPAEDELTDSDIFEEDGQVKRMTVTCPPPSVRPSDRPSARYSIVVPRSDVASMRPAAADSRVPRPVPRAAVAR